MLSYPRFFAALMSFCIFSNVSYAIIHHPGKIPGEQWAARPSNNIMGRWGKNASCVAIAPNYVITTIHQGGNENTIININSQNYAIDKIWTLPKDDRDRTPDIRLVRLKNANLTEYVPLYKKDNEINKPVVIGGFGRGYGKNLYNEQGKLYAYEWGESNNNTLRWCTNTIDAFTNTTINSNFGTLCGPLINASFKDPSDPNVTEFEGIISQFDSGGGWFIFDQGKWHLLGLSNLVANFGFSQFRNPANPDQLMPDKFYAMRISSYAEYIENIIKEETILEEGITLRDFNGDGIVDLKDYQMLTVNMAGPYDPRFDINKDGVVDFRDLHNLLQFWLKMKHQE